jgi:carboxypeptidase family protein
VLGGTVADQVTQRGIPSAVLDIVDGPNASKEAIASADGTYVFQGLSAGDLTIRLAATGYVAATKSIALTTNTQVTFAMQPASRTIDGHVTDGVSRGVLPNVIISVLSGASAGMSTRTDPHGDYTLTGLTPDAIVLVASATSYIPVSRPVGAGSSTRVDFVLPRVPPPPPPPQPPLNSAVISFAGIGGQLSPFTTYVESGFTIAASLANWTAIRTFGHPAPFIQFEVPAGASAIGDVRVTAGGRVFRFQSVDVYSSTTQIPWTFTGFLSSVPVFTANGVVGHTFGNFATVGNIDSTVNVDALVIRLTNPAFACCSNPVGLDNILVVH